jgi:cytochrome d ubiquinol oxidase subunit I
MSGFSLAAALPPVDQEYLLQAREMQALSFVVHIPLVAFAISFPAMVLFVEWLGYRTGDPLYLTLARRWTRVMVALFAVGAITGTVLSFEMGLLWPNFTGTFGGVFGLGFAIEGFSFFIEAIFIGVYVYGWGRLSPRAHLLTGIPIVIAGVTGSLMVLSVNAWMNHPGGFDLRGGEVVNVHPWKALFGNSYLWHELTHMYIAGYIVTGFIMAGVYAAGRLRGRWGRYERVALIVPLTIAALASPVQVLVGDWAARTVAEKQPIKLAAIEGLYDTTRGAPESCELAIPFAKSTCPVAAFVTAAARRSRQCRQFAGRRFRASPITSCVGTDGTDGRPRPRSPGCRLARRSVHLIAAGTRAAPTRLYEGGPVVKPLCQFADTSLSFAG